MIKSITEVLRQFYLPIFMLIQLPSLSTAEDYFVFSLSEFNSAVSQIQPGDTITLANGEWTNAQLVFQTTGTSQDSILLRAELPGQVILNGTSTLRIAGDYLVVDGLYFKDGYSASGGVIEFRNGSLHSNHCRLNNTAIVDYNPASSGIDYKWVSIYGTNNRVDHCYFRGKNHSGTTLVVWFPDHPHYHQIDHNYFAYRPDLGTNGGETIRIGTSDWSMFDSYSLVENNYFEACDGEIEIISNKSGHNTFRYNTFYECRGTLTLRHGNFATVEGNFFFGNFKSNSGGVRIIGEDHIVMNNYFQDLSGSGLRAAVSIMNGVPNSPLNRYFQVKRAQVIYNTIVNCYSTLVIGAGKDAERTLPPEDCIIANNLGSSTFQLIDQVDDPINLLWEGNIMDGPLGIPQPPGITLADPQFLFAEDSLWRPSLQSPAIAAAVDNYPFVIDDMDGQNRGVAKDVGADQSSMDPILRRPLKPEDVGPNWTPSLPEPPGIIHIAAGIDSLKDALLSAQDGSTIELITSGGIYSNNSNLIINKKISIRAAEGMDQRPIIRQTEQVTSTRIIFEIQDGGSLYLQGLELDGMAGSATPAKYLIRTDDQPMSKTYTLKVEDCYLHDVVLGSDGNFFRAYAGTFADTIRFENCLFQNSGKEGIRLKDEAENSGLYNVAVFEMSNCTMWNTNKEAITIYAGDDIPSTPSPFIIIDHCTFDSCGYNNSRIIYAREADFTVIKNSIFSNSPANDISVRIDGSFASLSYSDTFNVGPVQTNRNAKIGAGMMGVDPLYMDRFNGNFTLAANSPVLGKADDGKAMGDLRWDMVTNLSSDLIVEDIIPADFTLEQNYPNPFNPSTAIRYDLRKSGWIKLSIYSIDGSHIVTLVEESQKVGTYAVKWRPEGISSGIYLYRIDVNGFSETKKMIFIR